MEITADGQRVWTVEQAAKKIGRSTYTIYGHISTKGRGVDLIEGVHFIRVDGNKPFITKEGINAIREYTHG